MNWVKVNTIFSYVISGPTPRPYLQEMKFTMLEPYLGNKRQMCPQTIHGREEGPQNIWLHWAIYYDISKTFLDLFFSNCKSSQWSGTAFSLHYFTYEITSFSGLQVKRQFERFQILRNNNKKRKQRKIVIFGSYIKNVEKVSHFNRNKYKSQNMINCFVLIFYFFVFILIK